MDIQKYEVFLTTVEEGSFSKASERLGYTQSGITHMMNSLEAEVGFQLLVRGSKGVFLTEEGRQILPTIRELIHVNQRLGQECAQVQGIELGSISMACIASITIHWMPQIIDRFRRKHPNINISLVEEDRASELMAMLADGRVDVAFCTAFAKSKLDFVALKEDPMLAVLPPDHPMTARDTFPLERFAQEPSFLMHHSYTGYEVDMAHNLKKKGIDLNVQFSSNFDQFIISMVGLGLGISIMPKLMLKNHLDQVAVRPLDPPTNRTLGIALRSLQNASPAVKKLIRCVESFLAELDEEESKRN